MVLVAARARGADVDPEIAEEDHPLPTYTSSVAPSITSCDVKSGDTTYDGSSIPASGSAAYDAVTQTGLSLYNQLKKTNSSSTADEDEPDIKKGVGINDAASCGSPSVLHDDKDDAKNLACSDVQNEDFIKKIQEENDKAHSSLACQRGVLKAITGEFSCFAKQLTAAEKYLGQVASTSLSATVQAGQAQMKSLNEEVADRVSQQKDIDKRLNDPVNGMYAAKKQLEQLDAAIPTAQSSLNNQIRDLNEISAQSKMAKTMECLNKPQPGWPSCIKSGSTSAHAEYKSAPSPIEYLRCIYAQQANVVSGGSVVKNPKEEQSRIDQVTSVFGFGGSAGSLDVPVASKIPTLDYKKGAINGDVTDFAILTPDQLNSAIAGLLGKVSAATAGKAGYSNLVDKFKAQITVCYNTATATVAKTEENFRSSAAASNASQMRTLAQQYAQAVKSATGNPALINTGTCEKAKLEDQATCLTGMGAMAKAILDGTDPSASLTGVASSLTNNQKAITGFSATIDAKNSTARTLTVDCSKGGGMGACIAQYEGYQRALEKTVTNLQDKVKQMPTDINNRIDSIAQCVVSGGNGNCQGTGVTATGGFTLNDLSKNLSDAKEKIVAAMGALGIADSLDLKNVDAGDAEKDASGIYSPAGLKNLLLKAMSPSLLANDASGFKSAKDEIKTKDDELAKSEKGMKDYELAMSARAAQCKKDAQEKLCTNAKSYQEICEKKKTNLDEAINANQAIIDKYIALTEETKQTDDGKAAKSRKETAEKSNVDLMAQRDALMKVSKVGEKQDDPASPTSSLSCGTADDVYSKACFGDQMSDLTDKSGQGTGNNKNGTGYNTRTAQ